MQKTNLIYDNNKVIKVLLDPEEFLRIADEQAKSQLTDEELYELAKATDDGTRIPAEYIERIVLEDENPIKVFRDFRNLTQVELAKKANISFSYLNQVEGGHRIASKKTKIAIANALDIDPDFFDLANN